MATDVTDWLHALGLGQYAKAFLDNDIDVEVLSELTADDLVGLGVRSIGHRRKLLAAIAASREVPAAPASAGEPENASLPGDVVSAERRQLTVMFCDLAGSTALSARLDPEDMREVIRAYQDACTAVIVRHDGFVAKFMGDGLLAYFGYPRAHEDEAERSLRAGLAIAAAVGRLQTQAREALQVRIGIATGPVVVGDLIGAGAAQEQSVVGETPNLAARLQALAAPDAIVIADATRRQVGGLFELRDLGPQTLKGFDAPQLAWQVLGESDIASRFEALRSRATALVGREEELELLMRRWANAASGEGRAVLISAEPGVGKSRLTEAVQERIAAEPHRNLRYFCSPYHRESALHPIIGQLERAAGFERNDDGAAKRAKLAALLAGSAVEPELPLLADLLSLPLAGAPSALELTPDRKKEKTLGALLRLLEELARQQPVLMVFEDLHWMDPTSRELLDRTMARLDRLPVLLIATFRPEFQPPWTGQAHVSTMALSRLGRREGAALVRQLAGNAALPADIVEEILARTDGVPLFLEEVTKVVLEAGTATARGALSAIPGARPAVPATLQASLMARLDRLGAGAREVAQAGSAIGRDFPYDVLVAAVPRAEAETQAALEQLVAAGLVFQRGVPPTAAYQFKHALVQDTAYSTLLRGPRQALHGRIAEALEKRAPEGGEREPELLAHHLAEAGQPMRAAQYWLDAGRRGAGRSANSEAIAHFRHGIEALAPLAETPERLGLELALQLALGPVLMANEGFASPQGSTAYLRARDLAERLRDDRALFAAVWGQWLTTSQTRQGYNAVGRLVDELFKVAEPIGDPGLRMQAHHAAWATQLWTGKLTSTHDHVTKGLALYDREKHGRHALLYGGHDPGVCGAGQGAIALWALGYPDQSLKSLRRAFALADSLAHTPSVGHALWLAGLVHMLRRDAPTTLETGERLLALGREHGFAHYRAAGGIMRGWARGRLGAPAENVAELRETTVAYRSVVGVMLVPFLVALAETEMRAGLVDEAGATLLDALAVASERAEPLWLAGVMRAQGDLALLATPADLPTAEQRYDQSIGVARKLAATSLELQAALGLARLWRRQGKVKQAGDLVAPIHARFTEGFDTPDLIEAKALLESRA